MRLFPKRDKTTSEEGTKEELDVYTRGKNLLYSLAAISLVILFTLFVVAMGLELLTSIAGSITTIFGYFGAKGFGGLVKG